jgi:hypothetical protein
MVALAFYIFFEALQSSNPTKRASISTREERLWIVIDRGLGEINYTPYISVKTVPSHFFEAARNIFTEEWAKDQGIRYSDI